MEEETISVEEELDALEIEFQSLAESNDIQYVYKTLDDKFKVLDYREVTDGTTTIRCHCEHEPLTNGSGKITGYALVNMTLEKVQ